MLILALDTSSPSGSIAVLRDETIIGTASTWREEVHSTQMFRQIDFLLQEFSLNLEEFELFAVVTGPGSFTGLRVGLAAVKAWAEVYRKPIAAVSGLEAVAVQSHSASQLLVPVLDARRGQIYFGIYRRHGAPEQSCLLLEGEECVATPEEFSEALRARVQNSDFTIVTPSPDAIREALSRLETTVAASGRIRTDVVSDILAPHVGRLGYLHARRGELADALTLDANYIRRSDAELHLKEPSGS
ncbi:MAG: tRNA (adenosine(37)-N6)-threonylcarbamoyltransferase complex dimerization subunit type 1 TsaB [Candidatus Acidiferrales bacterium]